LYRYKFIARDFCFKKDSAYQYFKIKNEEPEITCPKDTVVDCIKHLVIQKDPPVTTSCSLRYRVIVQKPKLVFGHPDCPGARYELEYEVRDTCGRNEHCIQHITIDNDPPTIKCPPDKIVECERDIKKEKAEYTTNCDHHADLDVEGPTLVKGKANCDGSVYELKYTVTDSCERSASCIQKFTIHNKGPEIICPPNEEVQCEDDINAGPPKEVKVTCDLKYDIKISDPVLIIGRKNCQGAVYQVIYTVTDECGRTDECEQLFTILKDDIQLTCPPDKTVHCKKDIAPSTAIVKTACKNAFNVTTSPPKLISGKENCAGARYQILYHVEDECGRTKDCLQTFTIDNRPPEIVCYPDMTVQCEEDFEFKPPVPLVDCDLNYTVDTTVVEIKGSGECDGNILGFIYTVTDECGRSASCLQQFTLRIPLPVVKCAPDEVVDCEDNIRVTNPTVTMHCDQTYAVQSLGPVLTKGLPNCPGAEYTITYTVTDDCERQVTCTQYFNIENSPPTITCPPDRTVECKEDIKEEDPQAVAACNLGAVYFDGPYLESGKDNCPNAVYTITYTVE
ncbi:MAG TPA: hypothetical protein VJ508_09335, partial [Saprospiraceae bacterium]|nr:hypothetical protein [Saprospiraceae bacterium]